MMDERELARFFDPTGKCADPRAINAVTRAFGMEPADIDDFGATVELCCGGVAEATVTPDILSLVHGITRCAVQLVREDGRITGMMGSIPLRPTGVQACEEGWFDPAKIDPSMIARPFETPAANYGWGFIGVTKEARRRIMRCAGALGAALQWNLDCYCRPVTADGVRVIIDTWGFTWLPGDSRLAKAKASGVPITLPAQQAAA